MKVRIEVEVTDLKDLETILKALPVGVADRMTIEPVQEVDEVEVTYDTSMVHVASPESPLGARRSGAKNLSDPIYQNAFISEARASMGQPGIEDARALLGKYVKLTFNVDWQPAKGVLTDVVVKDSAPPYLLLDNYRERAYPLNAIQAIEVLAHEPGSHPSTP